MARSVDYDPEAVIWLLKRAATDRNKKARRHTAYLLCLDVSDERKREEVLPLALPLLSDASSRVRSTTAWLLGITGLVGDVPLVVAAKTLVEETRSNARQAKEFLLRRVIAAHEADGEN